MHELRFGVQFRALRVRQALRQSDVGRLANVSRAVISRIERGLVGRLQIDTLERAATALGATVDIRLRWRGEQLDRLVDEAHAALVDRVVALLRALGWEVVVEASFSIWGERGSIDVLASDSRTGFVLVVEVKSVVPDSQATVHDVDRKTRLAPQTAAERGWAVRGVGRLLVVGESSVSRRRVARLAATYASAFPLRGAAVRRWLRMPDRPMSGLLFLAFAPPGSTIPRSLSRLRVRKRDRLPNRRRSADNALPGRVSQEATTAAAPVRR